MFLGGVDFRRAEPAARCARAAVGLCDLLVWLLLARFASSYLQLPVANPKESCRPALRLWMCTLLSVIRGRPGNTVHMFSTQVLPRMPLPSEKLRTAPLKTSAMHAR